MHADQCEITVDTVSRLIASQFPRWSGLPIQPVRSYGTVNALFRLGEDIVLRLPLRPRRDIRDELRRQHAMVERIAARVPVPVPEPLAIGEPGSGYDGVWAAYRWIPGETASEHAIGDADRFAEDLAGFVTALHTLDTGGGTWNGKTRGGPLHTRDSDVRRRLAECANLVDTVRLTQVWERCLRADIPATRHVWLHADLLPGNLLVRDGRLAAVIDLETACIGDPAVDLMPAWNLLPPGARDTYRRALGVNDATWERGRGWALSQAIVALPYYLHTNPVMVATARRTLAAVLED